MLIFVIVIIAYGVTSQALMYMYLQRDPYPLVFRDIFYYPYWSLAGELYLDEMQGAVHYYLRRTRLCFHFGLFVCWSVCPSDN